MTPSILLLATGGTIAGRGRAAAAGGGYVAGAVALEALVANTPGLDAWPLRCETVAAVDSKDMDFDLWQRLALRCAAALEDRTVQAVVITHGTDTLEETAWFLHRSLAPAKPVVLTGAMRPATAASPDGPQNLLDAVTLAGTSGASGVLVTLGGRVFLADGLRKWHGWLADAFASGDRGAFGELRDGALRRWQPWPGDADDGADLFAARARRALGAGPPWPWVEVVCSHAGADARAVDALRRQGVDGLVVAGTGAGTVHAALLPSLRRCIDDGIAVRVSSRCAGGPWAPDGAHPLPMAPEATVAQARVSLWLELLLRARGC